MARGAIGADLGDDRKREVLGGEAVAEPAVGDDPHAPWLLLPEGLRRQHMGNFGRTDSKGERTEGAMGRGVTVTADDQEARQGQPQFRPNDVNDALPGIFQPEQGDALIAGILIEVADHARDLGIGDRLVATARRHIMVGDAECQLRLCDAGAAPGQLAEGVKRAFMNVVPVDPEQGLAVAFQDLVLSPEFVEQGQRRCHATISCSRDIAVASPYCMVNDTK